MIAYDDRTLPAMLRIVNDKQAHTWLAEEATADSVGMVPDNSPNRPPPYFQGESRQDIERKLTYAGYKPVIRNRWERTADKGDRKK